MNLLVWYRSLMRSVGATLVKLIATATSGLVSFTTNVIRPVKVVCEFSPVQEGTGDPSPDNVRPISGWTGATVNRIAKYYYSAFEASSSGIERTSLNDGKTIHIQGTATVGVAYTISSDFVPESESLTIFGIPSVTVSGRGFCLYDVTDGDVVGDFFKSGETVIRTVRKTHTYRLGLEIGARQSVDITITPRIADTDSYITLPINWQSEAGTVYGGTVTLNEDGSADITKLWEKIIVTGNESVIGVNGWTSGGTFHIRYHSDSEPDFVRSGAGGADLKCNMLTPMTGSLSISQEGRCGTVAGNFRYFIFKNTTLFGTTVEECRIKLREMYNSGTPLEYCAVLPTSKRTVYHFDNIGQLKSFLGTNNIWHNMNGDITVEYWNKQ